MRALPGELMQLSDDEVRAIDEAARVLRRVALSREKRRSGPPAFAELSVYEDGSFSLYSPDAALPIDKIQVYRPPGQSPGEALRRLVGR